VHAAHLIIPHRATRLDDCWRQARSLERKQLIQNRLAPRSKHPNTRPSNTTAQCRSPEAYPRSGPMIVLTFHHVLNRSTARTTLCRAIIWMARSDIRRSSWSNSERFPKKPRTRSCSVPRKTTVRRCFRP